MLQAAHGPNQERLRLLHGNFSPESTTCAVAACVRGSACVCVCACVGDDARVRRRVWWWVASTLPSRTLPSRTHPTRTVT
jgi:hypothetical protein